MGTPFFVYGGEGGIRTLDTLLTYTPLAGARLQPLGHFSGRRESYHNWQAFQVLKVFLLSMNLAQRGKTLLPSADSAESLPS